MRDRTSDTLEDELDNIRQGIYEKIKDMHLEVHGSRTAEAWLGEF